MLLVSSLALTQVACNGDDGSPSGRGDGSTMMGPDDASLPSTFAGEPGRLSGITAAHNVVRRATGDGLRDLEWNEDIAATAQGWADELASRGCRSLVHSGTAGLGENIAAFGGTVGNAERVVDMWVSERDCYTYGTFMQSDSCEGACVGCGHYTQVVWQRSRRLGCGFASCGDAAVWVCNYDPPGNVLGQTPY